MKDAIEKDIIPKLDEISKFVNFNRKKIKEEVRFSLLKLGDDIGELQSNKDFLEVENNNLNSNNMLQNDKLVKANLEIERLLILQTEQKEIIEEQTQNNLRLEKENASLLLIKEKFDLISSLLSTKPFENIDWYKFKELLHQDFFKFANEEDSLANEAEAVLLLQAIEKELEILINFSAIYNKNIIALGGGFSSGKSAFINSFFFSSDIKLPIGIKPVTAIPTYVVYDDKNEIRGYQKEGGSISIDPHFYKGLSHDFVKSFNFNLKSIMPFMTIGTPLGLEREVYKAFRGIKVYTKFSHVWAWDDNGNNYFTCDYPGIKMKKDSEGWYSFYFEDRKEINCRFSKNGKTETSDFHFRTEGEYYFDKESFIQKEQEKERKLYPLDKLCFIDTPGYNPAVTEGYTKEDINTAKEYLEQSHSLLWIIGLDTNGTFPSSDLKFLEGLNLTNKKLFIICNKSDVRPLSDVKNVLDDIAETLEDYDISYEGISAFSSNKKKEYFFIKKSIFQFLEEENSHSIQIKEEILERVNAVLDLYKDAITQNISEIKESSVHIKSLELDLMQAFSYDEKNQKIEERLQRMKMMFSSKKQEGHLKQLKKLRKEFEICIRNIFGTLF
ncbi:MAG: dynamin family protein [Candidatus Delongbacteria bacterium]|nr:dynamin family protein [Candidatus Delongbacteria bacterium]MBN2836910.1 dynamin family protein [Candidatus Delongbacteria bacterium]